MFWVSDPSLFVIHSPRTRPIFFLRLVVTIRPIFLVCSYFYDNAHLILDGQRSIEHSSICLYLGCG